MADGFGKVTYAYNYWSNLNSRTPSFRFGTGHIYNNGALVHLRYVPFLILWTTVFDNNNDGINTRDAAQLLVENNVWSAGTTKPLYSTDSGYAVARGNDFGGGSNTAPTGTLTSVPYTYSLTAVTSVRSAVVGVAGATLSF